MTGLDRLEGRRVLMVYAHCDDELVCGWPVLQVPGIHKEVIIVSSDENNPERRWCAHRKQVTIDYCRSMQIPVRVLSYNSDFFSLNHRKGKLSQLERAVLKEIRGREFDFVMTHNLFGEYGHLDHKFLAELLLRTAPKLLTTDIIMPSDWSSVPPQPSAYFERLGADIVGEIGLDADFYLRGQRFYETRGAWTWSVPPPATARVLSL